MSLTNQLAGVKKQTAENVPAESLAIMLKSTEKLQKQHLSENAFKKGDTILPFTLPNINSTKVSLEDITNKFTIISFYRGGWCPYCNLELKALQAILPELTELNTALVAITPETPDNSLTTSEKNKLNFEILSDIDNVYAKSLGLVFQMPENLRELYHSFNLNVDAHNGNKNYELPMPATYIINDQKEIVYSFVPEDYTERLDPTEILDFLKS